MMCISFHAFSYLPCFGFIWKLHQCCTIFYREGKATLYLIYKGQREHVNFITTLGGRHIRDPYIFFLDEVYGVQGGKWLAQEELKTESQVQVFPCHVFQFSSVVEFHFTSNMYFWLQIELQILLNTKFCTLT